MGRVDLAQALYASHTAGPVRTVHEVCEVARSAASRNVALLTARVRGSEQGAALGRVAGTAAVVSSLGPLAGGPRRRPADRRGARGGRTRPLAPDGFLPREIITNGTVLRSAFAAAAIPASLVRPAPRGAAGRRVLGVVAVSFGVGQPAMVSSVGEVVPAARRGVATLVFLVGASVGAALVGGLADVVGVPGAFLALVVLPVAGVVTLLVGGPPRAAPTVG